MQKRTLQLMDNKKNREERLSHYGAELTNKLCIPPSELGTQQEGEGRGEEGGSGADGMLLGVGSFIAGVRWWNSN